MTVIFIDDLIALIMNSCKVDSFLIWLHTLELMDDNFAIDERIDAEIVIIIVRTIECV